MPDLGSAPVCRGCIAGQHCGGRPVAQAGGYVRCECVVCEWVTR